MKLKELYESFNQKESFTPGDIVAWKPGLKIKRSDGPFIVVENIDPPIMDSVVDSGSTYFREPLDVILGHVDNAGDFVCYHYDSRRFTKVE